MKTARDLYHHQNEFACMRPGVSHDGHEHGWSHRYECDEWDALEREWRALVEAARADCAVLVCKLAEAESTAHDHCQARVEAARFAPAGPHARRCRTTEPYSVYMSCCRGELEDLIEQARLEGYERGRRSGIALTSEEALREGFADGLRHAAGQLDYLAAKLRNQEAP